MSTQNEGPSFPTHFADDCEMGGLQQVPNFKPGRTGTTSAAFHYINPKEDELSEDEGVSSLTNSQDYGERQQTYLNVYRPNYLSETKNVRTGHRSHFPSGSTVTKEENPRIPSNHEEENLQRTVPGNQHDSQSKPCDICHDVGPVKYFGANCCGSCEIFFRERIAKEKFAFCKSGQCCIIDVERRDICQYCRMMKCFKVGLMREAILHTESDEDHGHEVPENFYDSLEYGMKPRDLKRIDFYSRVCSNVTSLSTKRLQNKINLGSLVEALKENFIILVSSMISLREFSKLPISDRLFLLSKGALQWSLFDIAYRSLALDDALVFGEDLIISRSERNDPKVSRIVDRTLNELVASMRSLHVNGAEFASLKNICFFNTYDPRFVEKSRIQAIRRQLVLNLDDYEEDYDDFRGRFGQLLLLLPIVKGIANDIFSMITSSRQSGEVEMFALMHELYIGRMHGATLQNFNLLRTAASKASQLTGEGSPLSKLLLHST